MENGSALKELQLYTEIDNQFTIGSILHRCPAHIREKWQTKALSSKIDKGSYPKFDVLVSFIQRKAAEYADPLYSRDPRKSILPKQYQSTCNVLHNDSPDGQSPRGASGITSKFDKCVACDSNHPLFQCVKFNSSSRLMFIFSHYKEKHSICPEKK